MKIVQMFSPNFNSRPCPVDCVVLHATADNDAMASVAWCCDRTSKVSYHTIIGREGQVYHLVDTDKRAWHAGVSSFQGRGNCNDYSIGLSFGNDNAGEQYTEEQYLVAAALVAQWMKKHPQIERDRITTHKAIALPAGRKTDPADPFDMEWFLHLLDIECGR